MSLRLASELQQQLRDRGLILNFYPEKHILSNIALVRKPTSVAGHGIEFFAPRICSFADTDIALQSIESDAPALYVGFSDEHRQWFVCCLEHGAGAGGCDFANFHQIAQLAVDDVIDFFFGQSDRIEQLASHHAYLYDLMRQSQLVSAAQLCSLLRRGFFVRPMGEGTLMWVRKYRGLEGDYIRGFADDATDIKFSGGPYFDGPTIYIQKSPNLEPLWQVSGVNHFGVPGAGDFQSFWASAEDAINEIFDYHFGPNNRMSAYAKGWGMTTGKRSTWDGTALNTYMSRVDQQNDFSKEPRRVSDEQTASPRELSARQLSRLEAAGLSFIPQKESAERPGRGGFSLVAKIEKPGQGLPGNHIEGYVRYPESGPTDTPCLELLSNRYQTWEVGSSQYSGTRGPGDFTRLFSSESEAVDDILDYYSGQSNRMDAYARHMGCVATRRYF